jgi:single-strand DNA-binding protein
MTDLNVVTVVGRLVRDCGQQEFSYLQSGTAVAKISIAVNRSKKQADGSWTDEASFFDVAIFGKTAENLHPYLQKGKQVVIKGFLKQDRWRDKQTGENRSKISIVADEVQLLGGQNQQQGGNYQQTQQTAPQQSYQQTRQTQPTYPQQGGYQSQQTFAQPVQTQQPQQSFVGEGFPEDIPF